MIRLGEIAQAMGGWIHPLSVDSIIGPSIIDSRNSCENCLFFALKGSRTDGHAFVDEILENNGFAVVSRGSRREGVIIVDNVEKALLDAAAWRRTRIGSKVVAITGSSGKTTTRLFLTAALESMFDVYSTSRNLNNHLGMPITILNSPAEDPDIIVLELGMNHAGELLLLGEIASPSFCLITNIGRAHMEYFSTIDDIARAKAELIRTTAPGGICVIPVDEEILKKTAHSSELSIRYFGEGGDAWFERQNDTCIVYPWKIELKLQLLGSHNMMNAVAAILMAQILGVEPEASIDAISRVTPARGRGRIVRTGGVTILDESYNANPDSTRACLEVLRDVNGNKGAVLGDMRELGEEAPEFHIEILRKADSLGLDFLILTGEIYESVRDTISRTETFMAEDWKEALRILRDKIPTECIVLVKGSNSIRLCELVNCMEEGD